MGTVLLVLMLFYVVFLYKKSNKIWTSHLYYSSSTDAFVYIICPLPISSGINSLKVKVQYLVGYPGPIDALFGPRAKKICRVIQKKIVGFMFFLYFWGNLRGVISITFFSKTHRFFAIGDLKVIWVRSDHFRGPKKAWKNFFLEFLSFLCFYHASNCRISYEIYFSKNTLLG